MCLSTYYCHYDWKNRTYQKIYSIYTTTISITPEQSTGVDVTNPKYSQQVHYKNSWETKMLEMSIIQFLSISLFLSSMRSIHFNSISFAHKNNSHSRFFSNHTGLSLYRDWTSNMHEAVMRQPGLLLLYDHNHKN